MTSHHLTIAKASFAAACLRPDVTSLTRDELSKFHLLFEAAISKCSSSNIQACKNWLLEHTALSPLRSAALGKYLVSFAGNAKDEEPRLPDGRKGLPAVRQRLHILYVLNDMLHHAKYHNTDQAVADSLESGLEPQLPNLFQHVASSDKKRVNRRLEELLKIWEGEKYFASAVTDQLWKQMSNTERPQPATISGDQTRPAKEVPYVMPATHGDPSVPYYDLPAANLMPHIVPNKSTAMRADQVRALQLSAGPADESLVNAVKDFIKDVERMENPYQTVEDEGIVADMDELGQLSYRNEANELVGDTYYGWSREFCSKMKKRGQDETENGRSDRSESYNRSRSLSRSSGRGRSETPPKRRRYDSSGSHSQPRNHPHSGYRSRSRSPYRPSPTVQFKSGSPSLPSQQFPPPPPPPSINSRTSSTTQQPAYPPPLAVGHNGLVIPPRPADYKGTWPPPPPPLPFEGFASIPFLPPPPPPPPQF